MKDNAKSRLEMFSDGVFAIAATLLILEIKIPHLEGGDFTPAVLWHELARLWPSYLAFFVSFGTIFIIWINHHRVFHMVTRVSGPFMFANGFLLMVITFVPFPTALLATYINTPDMLVGVAVYNGTSFLINLAFIILWETMKRPVYLLDPAIVPSAIQRLNMQTRMGLSVYAIATIISFWLPVVGLILNLSLYLLWITLGMGSVETSE